MILNIKQVVKIASPLFEKNAINHTFFCEIGTFFRISLIDPRKTCENIEKTCELQDILGFSNQIRIRMIALSSSMTADIAHFRQVAKKTAPQLRLQKLFQCEW